MTCFELGFLSTAQEYGMAAQEASRILKSAYLQDRDNQLFKRLPEPEEDEDSQISPADLEALKEMLKQDFIDKHMSAAKHRIQL
jgi:hypothetical protein